MSPPYLLRISGRLEERQRLLIPAKETDKFCDKFVEIVTEILQEEDGKLWRGGQESPNLPCLLTTDNPFPPIIAKPHMEGYK